MNLPSIETMVNIGTTVASVILMGVLVCLTCKQQKLQHMQYELQERVFLREQAAFLVPYLVLVREVVSKRGEMMHGPSMIISVMDKPECSETEGTLGLYLTYLRNTMGKEAEKELLNIFNTIHEYAEKREVLPLNVKNDLVKRVNDLVNKVIDKYAVEPKALYPKECLRKHIQMSLI